MNYRERRHPTDFPISITARGSTTRCTVSSISASGACITGLNGLTVGQEVTFDFEVAKTSAIVKWVTNDTAGIAFDLMMSPTNVSRISRAFMATGYHAAHHTTLTEMR